MNLIIVESPTKAKTISKYLGQDYKAVATFGHIRDLPDKKLGVETENNFLPEYIVSPSKKERVNLLKAEARKAKNIILATDPDREGEAIAWHIAALLGGEIKNNKLTSFPRIVFHEITASAIQEAIKSPREIDLKLVNAQQTRRILDRLVGYKLSPLLWRKIRKGLSAGRVQSVAVRLIVEREREIEKFQSVEFYRILAAFSSKGDGFEAELFSVDNQKIEETEKRPLFDGDYLVAKTILTKETAAEIAADLKTLTFQVKSVESREIKKSPYPPYTTSTLQQDAGRKLGFSAKRTMQSAQKLYEEGLITYHRTDSLNLSEKFLQEAGGVIGKLFGKEYAVSSPKRYQTSSKLAQEAHEAIRPTNPSVTADILQTRGVELTRDLLKIYELIWKRALASQATSAVYNSTMIEIISENQKYLFRANGSALKFPGFLKIAGFEENENLLPVLENGEVVFLKEITPVQKFTSPPPRYNEPSLIKSLEEKGIGRPSTYAPIISTIQERSYVELLERKFSPTSVGLAVNDFLVAHFPEIVDPPFTAEMENSLDEIAGGQKEWVPVIRDFYTPFEKKLDNVLSHAERVKIAVEETEEKCPKCAKNLVIRTGRFGKFYACSGFPDCKYTKSFVQIAGFKCPECGNDAVLKKSARKKTFYGCANYPNCKWASWKKPVNKPSETKSLSKPGP